MQLRSSGSYYDYEASFDRIDDIISASDHSFEEVDSIPSKKRLTYTNGYYVNCTALFVDMCNSTSLVDAHTRPKLAKLYRAYISECVAVVNGNPSCREIYIEGDAVWGVFDTPKQFQVNSVFATAAKLNSLIKLLNCKFDQYGIHNIRAGIGMDYGRALMVKAGYKGSGLHGEVYMGEVVNEASRLSSTANRGLGTAPVMVSAAIHYNLKDKYKNLLSYNSPEYCYQGDIIDTEMSVFYYDRC